MTRKDEIAEKLAELNRLQDDVINLRIYLKALIADQSDILVGSVYEVRRGKRLKTALVTEISVALVGRVSLRIYGHVKTKDGWARRKSFLTDNPDEMELVEL